MSDFAEAAVALSPQNSPGWLGELQQQGRNEWQVTPLPTRKTEAWKYTSLHPLSSGDFLRWAPAKNKFTDVNRLRPFYAIEGLDAARLVFINGHFNAALSSSDFAEGLEVLRFAEADEAQRQVIQESLGSIADRSEHPFAALNDSWIEEGLFIRVAANTRIDKPLHVIYLTTEQAEAFSVQQRLFVELESGAELSLIEHFASTEEAQNSFTNALTELRLQANARLHHYRLQLEEEQALHIGGVHVDLQRDALYDGFHLGLGGRLKRIDVVVNHNGSGAHCDLNGVYLPRHEQHIDYHTCIEHRVPHCTTEENFRGIIGERARAVFNGRIHIHKDAQKTNAQLNNRNLLTSREAEIDTKPELEIYADDVQCAHGATIAQLEEKSLYYLQSRGIARREAEVMLSFGFINELINRVNEPALQDYLRPILSELFVEDAR